MGDTLTAKAGSTTVFVLTVKADGSWSFDLQDQLDHVVGGNDENFALQVAGGSPVSSIDFSKLLTAPTPTATRFGHHLFGAFTIAVRTTSRSRLRRNIFGSGTVEEDGMVADGIWWSSGRQLGRQQGRVG